MVGFVAFKDLQVSVEGGTGAKFLLEISLVYLVSKRATGDADLGDVYGVALEDEDKATNEEDLDRAGEAASINSSSSYLPNSLAVSSTSTPSANHAAQLVFKYDANEAVLRATEKGRFHEWTSIEFRAICKKHCLCVTRANCDLMGPVAAHFQQVYQVLGF